MTLNSSSFRKLTVSAAVILMILTTSCDTPVMSETGSRTNMDASGSLTVNLTQPESERSVMPEGFSEKIASYELFLTGIQAMGPILISEAAVLLENLPLGEYSISVSALDSDGLTLALGSEPGVVVTGETGLGIDIELRPVMGGKGSVSLAYDWSSAGFPAEHVDDVIATLTPTGGSPRDLVVKLGDNGLNISGTYPTGSYILACELFSDGELISSITETIELFDNLESTTKRSFGIEDFSAPPVAPGDAEAVQDGMSVNLSWLDTSELETGYRIMRSVDGGAFTVLGKDIPGNAVSWTDEPVEPGRDYIYRIIALNEFGESAAENVEVSTMSAVVPPDEIPMIDEEVIIGTDDNQIPLIRLLAGFRNTYDAAVLEIVDASLSGGGSARIDGRFLVVDVSDLPYESEGEELQLDFSVHIAGRPLNDTYTVPGSAILVLSAPELEIIEEDDLLVPVKAFVYDDMADLKLKMRLYDPPDPEEIFNSWGRISNQEFYRDGDDAEELKGSKNDTAGMAAWWKLKNDNEGSYIEYARNSVYAGLVCPDGEESDHYTMEATVSSKDDDDDVIGLIVAYLRDGDENFVLEAARSRGASSGRQLSRTRSGLGASCAPTRFRKRRIRIG